VAAATFRHSAAYRRYKSAAVRSPSGFQSPQKLTFEVVVSCIAQGPTPAGPGGSPARQTKGLYRGSIYAKLELRFRGAVPKGVLSSL